MEGLKIKVDRLDDVPEQLREHYAQDDSGKFRLQLDGDADVGRILKALRAERDVRKDAERGAVTAAHRLADATSQLEDAQRERDAMKGRLDAMERRAFAARLKEATRAAGMHDAAQADAERAAREHFRIGDDGELHPISEDGPSLGRWLETQREQAAHWWPATGSGGGAAHTSSGNGAPRTMSRQKFESLPPMQRAAVVRDGVTLTD